MFLLILIASNFQLTIPFHVFLALDSHRPCKSHISVILILIDFQIWWFLYRFPFFSLASE
jgi:hypothetical protein